MQHIYDIGTNDYMGVKFNSVFNELVSFLVCAPALPPCLGHDVSESVHQFNMFFCIYYFVANEWFQVAYLNSALCNFFAGIMIDFQSLPLLLRCRKVARQC